jgi:hypothetical protein
LSHSIPVDRSKLPDGHADAEDEDDQDGSVSERGMKLVFIAQKLFVSRYSQLISEVDFRLPPAEPSTTPAQIEADEKVRRLMRKNMEPDHLVKKRRHVQYMKVSTRCRSSV